MIASTGEMCPSSSTPQHNPGTYSLSAGGECIEEHDCCIVGDECDGCKTQGDDCDKCCKMTLRLPVESCEHDSNWPDELPVDFTFGQFYCATAGECVPHGTECFAVVDGTRKYSWTPPHAHTLKSHNVQSGHPALP